MAGFALRRAETPRRLLQPRRAGDPARLVSDNARILETLPWRPCHDNLDTIVRHALAWEEQLETIRTVKDNQT